MSVGETDLGRMLASLDVEQRPGRYTFVTGEWPDLRDVAAATIVEDEGPTHVVSVEQAESAGAPIGYRAAWLTLTVQSALESVGLTAAFSRALADVGIACNVLADYHHDHLLVPADRVDEAVSVLRNVGSNQAGTGPAAEPPTETVTTTESIIASETTTRPESTGVAASEG